jgi:CRISPR-associated endonuclease Csn1
VAAKGDGPFVLGIDLGTNSVGWSLVRLDHGKPVGLLRAGARVFDPGTDGDITSGRDVFAWK